MSPAVVAIERARELGATLHVANGNIVIRGRRAATTELAKLVAVCKLELVRHLAPPPARCDGDRACATCGAHAPIMLEMAPGANGVPWRLCGRCWRGDQPRRADPRR